MANWLKPVLRGLGEAAGLTVLVIWLSSLQTPATYIVAIPMGIFVLLRGTRWFVG